jgi:GT2 family glycosyltransferase
MKVFTIIVTFNGMQWIEECLNSVVNSSIPVSLIIIDNCSMDGTAEFVKINFPDVVLLRQNKNLGFGKANNIGISYALNQNVDFVFLLNQDAFLEKNTIENLIKTIVENPEYGILSPIQLDYSGKLLENYFFKFMANDNSRTFYSDFVLKNKLKKIYAINFIQAAAWLMPINAIKKIGGFDPLFYHYGEDDNYCQRILFHNLKIGVVPDVFIRHDSNKPVLAYLKPFSKKYFSDYLKNIFCKYADINKNFGKKEIKNEKYKVLKLAVKSLIFLKFNFFFGYLKQLYLFKKNVKCIEKSRRLNIKINSNYLDVN